MAQRQIDSTDPDPDQPTDRRGPKGPPFFYAVRQSLKEGYRLGDLRYDLMSGVVVGMVAIPLGMAFAIASGVPPQYGLYTVIGAGIIVALLGGSRFQVTGPTAAFVVILAPIAAKHGLGGLLTAGFLAGLILLFMGIGRMGKLIEFIPYPVTTGFTTGIAVVIATLQVRDFFGLEMAAMPDSYVEKVAALIRAFPTLSLPEFGVGAVTLALFLIWPRINKRIPSPLVVLSVMTGVVVLLKMKYPDIEIATIGTKFSYEIDGVIGSGIPQALPDFSLPWLFGQSDFELSLHSIRALIPSAITIALLGAIESLLSAVVADGMARTKHDPDSELVALGVGNIICPFIGGIAATGAIARTATNIRFGARSPFSSVVHGLFCLLVIILFAPYVSYLPMASLSALLMLIAYNMAELKHFGHIIRVGPKSDKAVLLICFLLTVIFDMVIGVTAGVLIAALLFMKRMAGVTKSNIIDARQHAGGRKMPREVLLYDINGPLFFGAAERAMAALGSVKSHVKSVFLIMDDVPVMDVTGLVALESAVRVLVRQHRTVYLVGVREQPKKLIMKSEAIARWKALYFADTVDEALAHREATRAEKR